MTVVVRLEHAVGSDGMRYCAPGLRTWFRRHGLDLRAFLEDGLPAEVLEATGDALALEAVRRARAATIAAGNTGASDA